MSNLERAFDRVMREHKEGQGQLLTATRAIMSLTPRSFPPEEKAVFCEALQWGMAIALRHPEYVAGLIQIFNEAGLVRIEDAYRDLDAWPQAFPIEITEEDARLSPSDGA